MMKYVVTFLASVLVASTVWAYLRFTLLGNKYQRFLRPTLWPVLYSVVLVAIAVTFVLGFSFHDGIQWWAKEDNVVEWVTFWLQVFAGIFFGYAAWRSRREHWNLLALAMSLLCFAIAGEEIAWGQHLLGFRPPDAILERNTQRELTIHNLRIMGVYFGSWSQAFGPFVIVAGFLTCQRFFPRAARSRAGFEFHPHIALLSLIVAAYVMVSSFPHQLDVAANVPLSRVSVEIFRRHSWTQSELSECVFSLLLLVAAVALSLRYASPGSQGHY